MRPVSLPPLWLIALQVACYLAVLVTAVHVWRRTRRQRTSSAIEREWREALAAADRNLAAARELAKEISRWSPPVESLR